MNCKNDKKKKGAKKYFVTIAVKICCLLSNTRIYQLRFKKKKIFDRLHTNIFRFYSYFFLYPSFCIYFIWAEICLSIKKFSQSAHNRLQTQSEKDITNLIFLSLNNIAVSYCLFSCILAFINSMLPIEFFTCLDFN